ncbi:MAG: hypothetical protein ACI4D1_06235 [Lachnospira sp.]
MKTKKEVFINIILPIMTGAVIYYIISPDVVFVQRIDAFIGTGMHAGEQAARNAVTVLIRNYLPDILWAYALTFSILFATGNNAAHLRGIFLTAASFSTVMEILQLTPLVKGTFDVADIIVEVVAELVAVFIIKAQQGGRIT